MTDHDNDQNRTEELIGAETAGQLIRQARERAGLTREQLAAQVNLLGHQIDALEGDRHDRLPGAMFVRGYLRNIARVLKLDEASLQAAWQRHSGAAAPAATMRANASEGLPPMRPISLERHSSVRRHWGIGAAALVVAGLWGWQQHEQGSGSALSSLTPQLGEGGAEKLGGIEDALSGNEQTRLLDSVELLPVPKTEAPAPQSALAAAGQNATQQPPGTGDTQVVTASGDQLSLRFSADCWVEIKDRDNRVLVAALKHANEKLQLEGRGPFRVLLGFAPGVEMAYNGTPVNIEVPQGSRSTRLIVGSS